MTQVLHLAGQTTHARKGSTSNAFRYGVDYVLADVDDARCPALFARNRAGLMSLWDRDHGGAPSAVRGRAWVDEVLAAHGLPAPARVELLAQPRVLGHVFNPVAFWLCRDGQGALSVVIAEVTNTYGDRHSYLAHRDDLGPIGPGDRLTARKCLHVSPFQPGHGDYEFRFDIRPDRIGIFIDLSVDGAGLVATLTGDLAPLTNGAILRACLRRPMGSRRVLALIHWQALKLWWKGALFRARPLPPSEEVSR